jgi:hypothetical protein
MNGGPSDELKTLVSTMDDSLTAAGGFPVRFLIVAAGRTGSTRLRLLLDSHPMVRCHGEVYGENLTTLAEAVGLSQEVLQSERAEAPSAFLARRVFDPGGARAVGCKILYHQLETGWPGLLDTVVADRGVHVIHLIRRNGIKRFLSEYVVGTVTHKNLYLEGEALPTVGPVHLPVDVLLDNLETLAAASDRLRGFFVHHPFQEIAYEDSRDDNGVAMQGLLAFLGLPSATLSVPIRKILPDNASSLISNLDEVSRALRGTRFEPMLKALT